jgi:hypothetical protein
MAGSWKPLTNQPTFGVGTMLLLTDGSVLCHESSTRNWHRLTPDAAGRYETGTWSAAAPLPDNPLIPAAKGGPTNAPLYFASAVLRDGSVFTAGGEYNSNIPDSDTLAAQVYDPVGDTWATVSPPVGWAAIGDAPCCVLADGRVLLGSIQTRATALFDPNSRTFSPGPDKDDASSEETWTLLPDGSVLTAECQNHPKAEKYVPSAGQWVSAGSTPVSLVEAASIEIGPAVLLPNGKVFAVGATGHTALYQAQAVPTQPGAWSAGPDFPVQGGQQLIAKDAPGCLLPNGRVLCAVGPAAGCAASFGGYCPPTYFFEYDPHTSGLNPVPSPGNAGGPPYEGRMLLLPTGQALFANGSADVEVYTPDGAPDAAWLPTITGCPTGLIVGHTYPLQGRQLNGLSQAVSYGDDATMATNYPLVRFRSHATNKVWYCRTAGHSTMGVATGAAVHTTNFTVPPNADVGAADLVVVANGLASAPLAVTIRADPCRQTADEVQSLMDEIDSLMEALQSGEIPPPPRTPAKIAAVKAFIARLRRQLQNELRALKACRLANP